MPEGWQPRGVTQRPRSGAAAESARLRRRRKGPEELPCLRGRGRQLRVPGCGSTGAAQRSYPMSEARGGGQEVLPYTRDQGWRPGGATPPSRSSGCAGTGGLRGVIPRSRSGGVAVRRYPSSKVRSSGCALLEQP